MRSVSVELLLLWISGIVAADYARGQVLVTPDDMYGLAVSYALSHLTEEDGVGSRGVLTLMRQDPFVLYQRGRDLVQRTFSREEGAMRHPGESLQLRLQSPNGEEVSSGVRMHRDHAASCGFCHNIPYGEPGAGPIIPSVGPRGRKTPHFFGIGLIEMIGEKIFGPRSCRDVTKIIKVGSLSNKQGLDAKRSFHPLKICRRSILAM